ncbi:helix-turn-helix transcriptional regulator [Mucilaginibacter sp. CAU 1740]|uniref:helix-turn-helix domain-containing protein n=1 Tax=Mucilaginibacter sp. CAU 1740 TaxID=3140365 RepID=UPI00325B72DC
MVLTHTVIRERLDKITRNIRKIREEKNFSQEYMATRLHISQNTYSKLELGYTALTVERLIQIAAILEISIIDLLMPDK